MTIPQLTSRIDTVKVYAAGATITRIAELQLSIGEAPEFVEVAGLPLALDDSSVRVRVVAASPRPDQGNIPIAGDVRIGLAVPPPREIPNPPADEELRKATAEVQRIQDVITLIDNEINVLNQLHVPDRPDSEPGKAPPPSPMSARLALANFSNEQIRARIQEKRETEEKLRLAQEHLADLQQKQALTSTARDVRPDELRKTVVVSLSYEGTPWVGALREAPLQSNAPLPRLIIEYFVPGARWTPTYVCRLNSAESTASIAVRALLSQRTGEDWSGVRLELSTAEPMAWCALPELPSLRLGKAQPVLRKSGWRKPPIGAEILFEDFDQQKQAALSAVPQHPLLTDVSSPYVPQLPSLVRNRERATQQKSYGGETLGSDASAKGTYVMFMSPVSDNIPLEMETVEPAAAPARSPARDREKRRATDDEFSELETLIGGAPSSKGGGTDEESSADLLAYGLMRMGSAENLTKRGKLSIEKREDVYLEILRRQQVVLRHDVMRLVREAVHNAQGCLSVPLPPGGVDVRHVAGSFDYAYNADGRVDVRSDGQFHSVALTSQSTEVDLRYVVVPREDTNVFRIAQLRNPLQAPLLSGPADIYVDAEYILSTTIATVPAKGQMELGLGVEQAIKVARNTFYEEVRSGETIVAFNELRHRIKIEITNQLRQTARIEVRERLPIPQKDAKVDVQIEQVTPQWEKYKQQEREQPIQGGYHWQVEVPGKDQKTLSAEYIVKTFVDNELIGGNRRE